MRLAPGVALGDVMPAHAGEGARLPRADVKSLQQYCDWMKGMLGPIPDGRYELVSFAADETRRNVSAYAVFYGTHSGQGGPVPPTGKKLATDYVYVMRFDGDKIGHMTKTGRSGSTISDRAMSGISA